MKKYRWQLLLILITGLVVGVLLLLQQDSFSQPVSITPNPISGGIYTEALIGEFLRLNPFLHIYNQPDRDVDSLLFSSLVKFDAAGLPQPDLAETWGISKDGTVYTFSLRPNLKWHDGTTFTTNDVAFTVSLLKSGNALIPQDLRNFWQEIQVNVLSDTSIQFALPEAFSPFLDYLAVEILPEHLLGNLSLDEMIDHPFNLAPIGSGPYKFDRLLVEDGKITGVVLKAFDEYYEGRPYLDEIVFQYYDSIGDAWAAYQDGEVEGLGNVSSDILMSVLGEPDVNLFSARKPNLNIVFLNLENKAVNFFQEASFRRALMMAVDRQRIINNLFSGQAIIAHGPIMPGNWAYYDEIEKIAFDNEGARQILASLNMVVDEEQEGLITETGQAVSFDLLIPEIEVYKEIALMLQKDWSAIGVQVEIVEKSYEGVISDLQSRNYEAALVDIALSGTPDPDPYPFWGQAQAQAGQNYAQWNNRSASEFLEQARINSNYTDRTRLYRNFQIIFQQEMPSLPLFYPVYNYAIKSKINNVSIGPLYDYSDRFNSVNTWYILAESQEPSSTETSINE
mgnify:CR=1 FL=1